MEKSPEILRENIIEISITGEELFNNVQDVNLYASIELWFDENRRYVYGEKFGVDLAEMYDKVYGFDEDLENIAETALNYYYDPETDKWEVGDELEILGLSLLTDPLFYEPTDSEDKLITSLIDEAVKELFQCSAKELYQKSVEDNKKQYAENVAEGHDHHYYFNRIYTVGTTLYEIFGREHVVIDGKSDAYSVSTIEIDTFSYYSKVKHIGTTTLGALKSDEDTEYLAEIIINEEDEVDLNEVVETYEALWTLGDLEERVKIYVPESWY